MTQRNELLMTLSKIMKDADPAIKSILKTTIKEIKAAPTEYDRCLRCGKKLTTLESRKRGYGEECYIKVVGSRFHKNTLINGENNANSGTTKDS